MFYCSLSLSLHRYYELCLLLSKLIYKEIMCNLNPVNVWVFPSGTICTVTFVISLMNISLVGPLLLRNLNVGWWACDSFQRHLSSVEQVLFCKQVIKVMTSFSNSRSTHLIWFHKQFNFELITELYFMFILSLFSFIFLSNKFKFIDELLD